MDDDTKAKVAMTMLAISIGVWAYWGSLAGAICMAGLFGSLYFATAAGDAGGSGSAAGYPRYRPKAGGGSRQPRNRGRSRR